RRGLRRDVAREEAGEDAHDVAVDEGLRPVERDARDRPGRVGTDPGEREQVVALGREPPAVPVVDGARRGLQRFRATVVPETAPRREDLLLRSVREDRDVRKALEEAQVV